MRILTPADLGLYAQDRRKRVLNISQDELAARVGASRHWVLDFEAGHPGVQIGLILRALNALGIDVHAMPVGGTAVPESRGAQPHARSSQLPAIDLSAIVDAKVEPLTPAAIVKPSGQRPRKGKPRPSARKKRT